ncbi:MAG: DUF4838 domain-containing protein, partial [Lentisphaerae bacterium]|nr:DUF4838 domain-containing protein [Lentisphaerota bacterium]
IGNVANFLLRSDTISRESPVGASPRDYFAGWGKVTKLHHWRPNVGAPVGFQWGMPDVPLRRTMEDIRFAADHGMMGIYVDYVREHWATQGPLYYLMAQLIWNPYADGEAILKDYYKRAFGPAAKKMEAYWNYMERIREECYGTEQPGRADHDVLDFYNKERLDKAYDLLNKAKAALGPENERHRQRIAFVEAGLDFTRLITECGRLVRLIQGYDDQDGQALVKLHANWEELRALRDNNPGAMRWRLFWGGHQAAGPPSTPRYAPTLWVESAPPAAADQSAADGVSLADMTISEEWELVFSDNFEREELGENWEVVDGVWAIVDGCLRGNGTVTSSKGFPGGFQRLEFEARTDVQAAALLSDQPAETGVSDISSFIHARSPAEGKPLRTGYFFQFGGSNNTLNRLRKAGMMLEEIRENTRLITQDKWHRVLIENDAGALRMFVDGELVLEHVERDAPLLGEGHDRVGFYGWTAYLVRNVNVYLKSIIESSDVE